MIAGGDQEGEELPQQPFRAPRAEAPISGEHFSCMCPESFRLIRVARSVSWGCFNQPMLIWSTKLLLCQVQDKWIQNDDVCWFPGGKLEFVLSRTHLSGLSPPSKTLDKWVVPSARYDHIKSICFMNT